MPHWVHVSHYGNLDVTGNWPRLTEHMSLWKLRSGPHLTGHMSLWQLRCDRKLVSLGKYHYGSFNPRGISHVVFSERHLGMLKPIADLV